MTIQANFPNVQPSLLLDFANAKQLPPQVTFTRATSATYYDGSTTAKAEQNLILQSQTFSNAVWGVDNITKGSATNTAPDGTLTATLIYPTATGSAAYLTQFGDTKAETATFSAYIKAQNKTVAWLYHYASAVFGTYFVNLSTGATQIVAGSYPAATVTATNVGNGWYRLSVSYPFTHNGLANWGIGTSDAMGSVAVTASGTDGIYIWGAQLEQRSSATAYTATTTQPITNYVPVLLTAGGGQPRFDHNPTTSESLGLLIEEQRTNLYLYSADLSNAYWDNYQTNLTSNTIIAPDGTLTGDKLAANTTNTYHYSYAAAGTVVSAGTPTGSVYAKAGERSRLVAGLWNGSNYALAQFDLANGTILQEAVAGMASITSVGNGWYRCTVNRTVGAGTTFFSFGPYVNNTIGTLTGAFPEYADDGFSGIYVWGAQLEQAAFATSYIPTTSAAATRAADAASMTGANFSSWFNNSQGTFVAVVGTGNVSTGARVLKISDTDSNRLIDFYVTSTPTQAIFSYQNNITSADFSAGAINTSKYLTAVSYKTGNISALVNGGSVTTSTIAVVSSIANSIFSIGYDPTSGGSQLSRPIAKIAYYPLQVTSAQLQALTS